MPWASLVALSRVAKGKHFISDVIFGGVLGAILGFLVECYCERYLRAVLKTLGGCWTVFCWGLLVVIPYFGRGAASAYYLFFFIMFMSVIPSLFKYPLSNAICEDIENTNMLTLQFW
jgi:hypothetical protein